MTELHTYILKDLDRTATCIKSSGLYTGKEKEMIFLVVSYKEVAGVKLTIKKADPRAFVVVTDAYDTFGEGWRQLLHPMKFIQNRKCMISLHKACVSVIRVVKNSNLVTYPLYKSQYFCSTRI